MLRRRALTTCLVSLLAAPLVTTQAGTAAPPPPDMSDAVVVAWARTANRTVFNEAGLAPPVGALYLGFTSLAVHDAVQTAVRQGNASPQAAAAAAAHDVLVEYFVNHPVLPSPSPVTPGLLSSDLAASLATVPDGRAENKGVRIGRRAAADMIASRLGDGRNDPSFVYSRPDEPGVWQPPPTGMLAPWLGYVRPLVLGRPVAVDGPDPLDSAAYAADFEEVRVDGSKLSTDDGKLQTARFFSGNPVPAYQEAIAAWLAGHPKPITRTARLFADLNAAVADAARNSWRLKFEVGYWRPVEAIREATEDGNDATTADPTWEPRVPTPPYSDYVSGHAVVTSSFAETVRIHLGDIQLRIASPVTGTTREYTTWALEHDALLARIWLGIHFRDAMEDGYLLGHETARRVHRRLG